MNIKKTAHATTTSFGLLCILLAGCASEVKLSGKRETIFEAYKEQGLEGKGAQEKTPIVLPSPVHIIAWPQPGGVSSHIGFHGRLENQPDKQWRPDWNATTGAGVDRRRSFQIMPVLAGDFIFTVDVKHHVSAFNARTGRAVWRTRLDVPRGDRETYASGLAHGGAGTLYVSTGYGKLVLLESATGEIIVERDLPAPARGGVTVFADMVILNTLDNRTIAMNAEDGQFIWEHQGVPSPLRLLKAHNVAVAENVVISVYGTGDVVALHRLTGRILWRVNVAQSNPRRVGFDQIDDFTGMPVIAGDYVLVSSFSGELTALNIFDGSKIWQREVIASGEILAVGRYVFLLDDQARALALDIGKGKTLWQTQLKRWESKKQLDQVLWTSPLLVENRLLFMSSQKKMMLLDVATGAQKIEKKWTEIVRIKPFIAGDRVYFLTQKGRLQSAS